MLRDGLLRTAQPRAEHEHGLLFTHHLRIGRKRRLERFGYTLREVAQALARRAQHTVLLGELGLRSCGGLDGRASTGLGRRDRVLRRLEPCAQCHHLT